MQTNLVSERLKGKNLGKMTEITLLGNSRITITHTPNMSWSKGGGGREERGGRRGREEGKGEGRGRRKKGNGEGEEENRGGRREKEEEGGGGGGGKVSIVESTMWNGGYKSNHICVCLTN